MNTIIFEVDRESGMLSPDVISIYDSYKYLDWIRRSKQNNIGFASIKDSWVWYETVPELIMNVNEIGIKPYCNKTLNKYSNIDDIIAIGSIEFTGKFIGKPIKSLNIPTDLNNKKYTSRDIFPIMDKIELGHKLDKYNELFIKGCDRPKALDPIIIHKGQDISILPDKVMASEVIDIIAEWRAFIFRKKIIDCKQYLGDYWQSFNTSLLTEAVNDWKNSPSAYTLDIGLTRDNRTVIIEAHNFLSCGLYGFECGDKLALMSSVAFKEEKYNESW